MIRIALIILFLTKSTFGQDFVFDFLRNDFERYLFSNFKLRPNHTNLDYMFYDSLHHCKQLVSVNVAKPMTNIPYRSNPKYFLDRVFSVKRIFNDTKTTTTAHTYPIFLLRDIDNGDTIYFKYNPEYGSRFPFLVNGVSNEEDEYCHLIEHKQLPVASIEYLHTPCRGSVDAAPVSLHKYLNGSKTDYTLSLRTYGTRPHPRVKGATVYLSDGSRITRKNATIKFKQTGNYYEYNTSIKLSPSDLKKLQQATISKHELYIYIKDVPQDFSHQLRMLANCIEQME